jgi:poly-gamma-glutamate system protein
LFKARPFKPSMRSNRTLAILTVVSVVMYLWANGSKVIKTSDYYEEKLAAATWMLAAEDSLRSTIFPRGLFLDNINDPNASALIGQQFTSITTETGNLNAKWTALNPNMAAIIVEYFHEAGLESGDYIAVGLSGSFPGVNLAVYAACKAMNINPVVIASVGASSWGANDPNFTWLDMESILIHDGMLDSRSVAASIGGGDDIGRQLSPTGREDIRNAITRNNLPLIENEFISVSILERIAFYDSVLAGNEVKLYINVGGGLASLGHSRNENLIGEGFFEQLPNINYPRHGVIHEYGSRGVPVLNLVNINRIAESYNLPQTPNPLPDPGTGELFSEERYNLIITAIALLVVIATMIVVLLFDNRAQRLNRPGVDPDTLI